MGTAKLQDAQRKPTAVGSAGVVPPTVAAVAVAPVTPALRPGAAHGASSREVGRTTAAGSVGAGTTALRVAAGRPRAPVAGKTDVGGLAATGAAGAPDAGTATEVTARAVIPTGAGSAGPAAAGWVPGAKGSSRSAGYAQPQPGPVEGAPASTSPAMQANATAASGTPRALLASLDRHPGEAAAPAVPGSTPAPVVPAKDPLARHGSAGTALGITPVSQPAGPSPVHAPESSAVPGVPGTPAWAQAFAHRTSLLVAHGANLARLTVSPPDLGRIDVSIHVHHGEASIVFVSPHTDVRQAIHTALPRLHDMLAQQGLNLTHADVSQHAFGQGAHRQGPDGGAPPRVPSTGTAPVEEIPASAQPVQRVLSLVDHYV